MSRDEFSIPPDAGPEHTAVSAAPDASVPDASVSGQEGITLRQQVQEIIDAALASTDPEGEWARTQLRGFLEARPGDPEGALLAHLIATRNHTVPPANAPLPTGQSAPRRRPSRKPRTVPVRFSRSVKKRIQTVLRDKLLLTAFQPINELGTGNAIGVEALTRFVGSDGASADVWFSEASAVGLGSELEIAALHCALKAAVEVPQNLFVAFNLTPGTCRDPRVGEALRAAHLAPERMVIELTGSLKPADGLSWSAALGPLRQRGLRLAVSAPGAGFVSAEELMQLRPDIIKLDRKLIERLHDSARHRYRAASIVELAGKVGATVVAEGIETPAELAAVTALGVTAGQGYLFGRPSVQPLDWSAWTIRPRQHLRLQMK
jgi:EAL domain-containing protein (putative c-di-GMP-specific phosphodiesterase class I)